MKINPTLLLLIFLLSNLLANSQENIKIISLKVGIQNGLRGSEYARNFDGSPDESKGYPFKEYEKFVENEVNSILSIVSDSVMKIMKDGNVTFAKAWRSKNEKKDVKTAFANKYLNNTPEQTISYFPYFPEDNLKESIVDTIQDYYEISMQFNYGGSASAMIVMNKQKKPGFCMFNVKTTITCTDKEGKEKWKKESNINDFSSILEGEVATKYYKIFNKAVIVPGKDENSKYTLPKTYIETIIIYSIIQTLKS